MIFYSSRILVLLDVAYYLSSCAKDLSQAARFKIPPLLYNVVLVSAVQQNKPALCIHIYSSS